MGDKDSESPPPDPGADEDAKKSGRVAFDSRGNPIWEWQMKTGVFGRDIDTKRLKTLEDRAHLSIAEDTAADASKPSSSGARAGPKKMFPGKPATPGGGFNPYDSSASGTPAPPARGESFDPLNRPVTKPQPKPGFFRRLFGKS